MMQIKLDGDWELYGFPEGEFHVTHPADLVHLDIEPIAARVPGNVELDLIQAGRVPDPFYGSNILKLRALEGFEWWYVRHFDLPEDAAGREWDLVFDGLDALAQVWINGELVGWSENAMIRHTFSVSEALQPGGRNQIAVQLRSVMRAARDFRYDASVMSWEGREEGLFIRKPPHCWGWDIMPRALSAGIWRSTWLEECPSESIDQLYFWTAGIGPDGARLGVHFQVRSQARDLAGCSLCFEGFCGSNSFAYEYPIEFSAGNCVIPIPNPLLWWPRGYGQANLYQVKVQLMRDDEVLAERVEQVGLRTLELQRSLTHSQTGFHWNGSAPARVDSIADEKGRFIFVVNGEPIMIKGTNWVPLDAFHSRDQSRLARAMELAVDLNCNMIRCWGGNVYESDEFFDLCDQNGVLVWQDFSYACCRYPQSNDFLSQVEQEAQSVVRRLRNHPSLAVWCGDNEVDMAYSATGLSPEQNRLTREILPRVVHRMDPFRPFIPSSPYLSPEAARLPDPLAQTPEQHLWGPRGYFKSSFYTGHQAHFIGEIGYHGCPSSGSVRKFISPEKIWPWMGNDEWQVHSTYHWLHSAVDRDRIKLMANQVREFFGEVPGDLDNFALASQITQAEAVKFFIESTRLRKWQTSGILWWNLIDGWPQFSDAVVDYYFSRKLAYYFIRRVQKPVCLIIGAEQDKYLPLVACNDSLQTVEVQYRVRYAGEPSPFLEGRRTIPANENWCLDRIRTFAGDTRMILMEWDLNGSDQTEGTLANHHLVCFPPVRLDQYRSWLDIISRQPGGFEFQATKG